MGKGYESIYKTSITDKTQALGVQTIDVSGSFSSILETSKQRYLALRDWQLQIEISGSATSGELAVAIKSPGAEEFVTFSTKADLTANSLYQFSAMAGEIKLTPTAFNGTSYSVYCVAS